MCFIQHLFHEGCLQEYETKNGTTCILCRAVLIPKSAFDNKLVVSSQKHTIASAARRVRDAVRYEQEYIYRALLPLLNI